MLTISGRPLAANARATLDALQALVDAAPSYQAMVQAAKAQWDAKNSTKQKATAFQVVRATLALMCVGPVRCAYCEDSLADEIEHILPKTFFPQDVFSWENYLFACGPCNGPKGNRYGILRGAVVHEFMRSPRGAIVPPPPGPCALINPRIEDPLDFFELDLGGTAPDGTKVVGTFNFLPNGSAAPGTQARAAFSIDVLGLNREIMRVARENAFGGFRARLREFADEKENGGSVERLDSLRNDLLSTPHLTVFAEMRRQKAYLPDIEILFSRAKEAEAWPLVCPNI